MPQEISHCERIVNGRVPECKHYPCLSLLEPLIDLNEPLDMSDF
jgi:hypothetical protein